jgi:hypothetical protein
VELRRTEANHTERPAGEFREDDFAELRG